MTQTLIEKLEGLPTYTQNTRGTMVLNNNKGAPQWVSAADLRAIIEQEKSEKQEPVKRLSEAEINEIIMEMSLGFAVPTNTRKSFYRLASLVMDKMMEATPQPDLVAEQQAEITRLTEYEQAVLSHFDVACHSYDSEKSVYENLSLLQAWHCAVALDPKVSRSAADLHDRIARLTEQRDRLLAVIAKNNEAINAMLKVAYSLPPTTEAEHAIRRREVNDATEGLNQALAIKPEGLELVEVGELNVVGNELGTSSVPYVEITNHSNLGKLYTIKTKE